MLQRASIAGLSVATVLLAGVSPVWATPGRGHGGPGGPGGPGMDRPGPGPIDRVIRPEMIEHVGAEIGVSAAVQEKIKETAYAAEKEQIQIRAKLDTARLDLRRAMDASEPDVKKVIRQVEAVGALETEMKKVRVRLMLTVRSMLTAEQRAKLQQIIRDRWAERHGGRGSPGDPRGPGRRPIDGGKATP